MQSGAPHWALSSGVIKAFKHHHPLSLHMSALQSEFVRRLVGYMFSLLFALFFFFPPVFTIFH